MYSSWNVDRYDEGNVNEIREMLSSAKSTSIFTAGLLRALSMLIFTVNPEEEQNVSPMALTKDPYFSGYLKGNSTKCYLEMPQYRKGFISLAMGGGRHRCFGKKLPDCSAPL